MTLSHAERRDLKVRVLAPGPIPAPVNKGAEIAKLVVSASDRKPIELPLVAGTEIGRLSAFGRIGAAFNHLLWGEQTR